MDHTYLMGDWYQHQCPHQTHQTVFLFGVANCLDKLSLLKASGLPEGKKLLAKLLLAGKIMTLE
jgi:hypothetical protein